MMRDGMAKIAQLPSEHPEVKIGKVGVLLVNLGTPEAPTAKALRPYLKQFLSDRRIIELTPLIWQPILNLIILNTRPAKSAKAYAKIWREESNESPLRYYTRQQGEALDAAMGGPELSVRWAMRYGQPSIRQELEAFKDEGYDRILVVPLYPQYSSTTTASVTDEVFRVLMDMRWQPALRIAPAFHDDPAYIQALADTVRTAQAGLDWEPDMILMSYHGIPKAYFDKGDPYHCHCHKTTRLVREALGLEADKMMTSFQSRFGPTEWLKPYTDETLESLAEQGKTKVMVLAPAFISDCIETLEEIAIEGREEFMEAGGTHFEMVPCLNDCPAAIALLEGLTRNELSGWVDPAS